MVFDLRRLPPSKEQRIFRLLDLGTPKMRIARDVQVSRQTVIRLATEPRLSAHLTRCPTCGGKVYLPCHACEVAAHPRFASSP